MHQVGHVGAIELDGDVGLAKQVFGCADTGRTTQRVGTIDDDLGAGVEGEIGVASQRQGLTRAKLESVHASAGELADQRVELGVGAVHQVGHVGAIELDGDIGLSNQTGHSRQVRSVVQERGAHDREVRAGVEVQRATCCVRQRVELRRVELEVVHAGLRQLLYQSVELGVGAEVQGGHIGVVEPDRDVCLRQQRIHLRLERFWRQEARAIDRDVGTRLEHLVGNCQGGDLAGSE